MHHKSPSADPQKSPSADPPVDHATLRGQQGHWTHTFAAHPDMYGQEPSAPAWAAATLFQTEGVTTLLELGAGQGRDALFFARQGFRVQALDFAVDATAAIEAKAAAEGLAAALTALHHDARDTLPFDAGTFDACYAHMLLCMALTTTEIERLVSEVRRVLRPGGLFVYTVRSTADAHYRAGITRGDDMYEHGGFIVHFFSRALVDRLATGWTLLDVTACEEGALPRRLLRVTMRRDKPRRRGSSRP